MCPDQRRQGPGRGAFAGLARGHDNQHKPKPKPKPKRKRLID